jgi:hypothetical protein
MNKKLLVVLVLIVAVVVISLSFFIGRQVGIFYQSQQNDSATRDELVSKLSSKLVVSIVVYGQVTKIEGRNVTLAFGGQQMTLMVGNNAKILTLSSNVSSRDSGQKEGVFGDIKLGDKLNMVVTLSQSGQLLVQSAVILPATIATK